MIIAGRIMNPLGLESALALVTFATVANLLGGRDMVHLG